MSNINSRDVLYSSGRNDEYYTPSYAVEPILKYIPKKAIVWCPFDDISSEFVKQIEKSNDVVYSHIKYDQDFYSYEPLINWDVMISNPPFTKKRQTFLRALSFNKPFALLMNISWLNDAAPKQIFKNLDLQLLMFDKRIHFKKPDGTVSTKTTFSSAYFCRNFLPKQIIMETLNKGDQK